MNTVKLSKDLEVWVCGFCGLMSISHSQMIEHEKKCEEEAKMKIR